jgi:hypothetical protein
MRINKIGSILLLLFIYGFANLGDVDLGTENNGAGGIISRLGDTRLGMENIGGNEIILQNNSHRKQYYLNKFYLSPFRY